MHRTRTIVAVLLGAALGLTGCTATPDSSDGSDARHPSAAGSPAPGLPAGVIQATDVPTDVPNDTSARADVAVTGCEAVGDGWAARGTAKNPTDQPKTYTLTVFFTTSAATVLHTDTTQVAVDPGGSADWAITGTFAAPAGTLCVLRGVA